LVAAEEAFLREEEKEEKEVDAGTETPRLDRTFFKLAPPLLLPPAAAPEEEEEDATMPHLSMNTSYDGAPDCDPTDSNAFTTE